MEKYTLQAAIELKTPEQLRRWCVSFLGTVGANKKLARILEEKECKRIELKKYPLSKLRRIMGPEEGMPFVESEEVWQERVETLEQAIKEGFEPPPLIVTDFWFENGIADGNHRHEALLRNGVEEYWTIFFKK